MNAEVKGSTLPILEMILEANEYVIATHGELSWMTPNIQLSQTTSAGGQQGGGGGGGLMGALKRAVGGGGLFLTQYQALNGQGMIVFAAKVPGRIFPVEIGPQGGYCVHRHGWVCGTPGIVPTMAFQQSLRGGLFGGDGFLLQKLEGQGTAYIELSGEITTYDLAPGQTLLVHPGHVGMFQDTVNFTVQRVQGLANRFLGQDGSHLAVLTGPGQIWLQSMPLANLAHALQPYLEKNEAATGASAGVAGGMLGGVLGRGI
jgi:uncharacterized protein (AIM24 family)